MERFQMKLFLMLVSVCVFLLTPCLGQSPAMAQDSQRFSISVDDCTRMARRTLEREGYQPGNSGGNGVFGSRDIHRAFIQCQGGSDGTWVNVVVASNTQDGAVAASEQRLLMTNMAGLLRNPRGDLDRERDRDRDRDGDRDRGGDRDWERRAWLSMTSQQPLPGNAVPGGQEPNHSAPQYVCRAEQDGNLVPGKTVTSFGTDCLIPYRETEVRKTSYDILTGDGDDYVWMAPNAGRPFFVGRENGADVRSCRFQLYTENKDRGRHLGKEVANKCIVSYKGIAYSSDRYEVLYRRER